MNRRWRKLGLTREPQSTKLLLVAILIVLSRVSALSSLKPQQLKFDKKAAAQKATCPEDLRELALENAHRTPGSLRYQRSWRHWSQLSIDTIRYYLSQNLPVEADKAGFSKLWFHLGVAADKGEMPSFACAGSRSGYALDFFCRARLLADLMLDFQDNPTLPTSWTHDKEHPLRNPLRGRTCRLLSIGGGPGFDYVSLALIASFHNAAVPSERTKIEASIYDYEEGWHTLVDSMSEATATTMPYEPHSCRWGGKCDITKPLSDPSNAACLAQAALADLFVCQYCVAENANVLRETGFCFFVDLFQRASVGSLFVFTETTPRVWPDFVDLLESRPDLSGMQIGFPRNLGRGKSGPQMVLRKVARQNSSMIIHPEQRVLCDNFRRIRAVHERKMSSNFKRQRRKIRGGK